VITSWKWCKTDIATLRPFNSFFPGPSGVRSHTHTHKHTQPFYVSLDFVWDNPREPIPTETFTHSHLHCIVAINHPLSASSIYYNPWPHPCSIYMSDSLFPQPLSKFSLVYLLAWHPPLHTPYISSPTHCLLFATHANTIATCFAVVPRLSSNPSLCLYLLA